MYTDLASMYERAGRIKNKTGSITQFPILSCRDDITHPIPDLTGYITEGQIVASRDLHRKGIFPPIAVERSLSRLMGQGIGAGHTRDDHRAVSDQLYAAYAEGRDLRGLVGSSERKLSPNGTGSSGLRRFVRGQIRAQGKDEDRTIEQTLDLGWELLSSLPIDSLTKIDRKLVEKYHPQMKKK